MVRIGFDGHWLVMVGVVGQFVAVEEGGVLGRRRRRGRGW